MVDTKTLYEAVWGEAALGSGSNNVMVNMLNIRKKLEENGCSIPLVLHGASGLSPEAVKSCIAEGICKVNFATELRVAYTDAVRKNLASDEKIYDPKKYGAAGREKVKQYVNVHYPEPLKLDDIADLVGMSPVAFSRFFRQRTGRTLSDYIIDIRLGYAARMLVDSSKNISEICYECGFNNLSNFNRTFKARRKYTPRDFRAMFKKNKVIV